MASPITIFGHKIAARIGSKPAEFVISPLSLWMALTLTAVGSNGDTLREAANALEFEADMPRTGHRQLGDVLNFACSRLQRYRKDILVANAVAVGDGMIMMPQYLKIVHEAFGGEIFCGTRPSTINKWVSQKTQGKITNLLDGDPADVVVLNAVYFKGRWRTPFDKLDTKIARFYGSKIQDCHLMNTCDKFSYSNNGAQVIRVPYDTHSPLSALIVLPQKGNPLILPPIASLLSQMTTHEVDLYLPRFEKTFTASFSGESLKMPTAFSNLADFSRMGSKNGKPLKIERVLHKAFLKVDEEGTEAAAATAVVLNSYSAGSSKPPPVVMRVDRPFIFAIIDHSVGDLLFVSHVFSI